MRLFLSLYPLLLFFLAPQMSQAGGLSIPDELLSFDRLEDTFRIGDEPLHPTQKEIVDVFNSAKREIQKMTLLKNYLPVLLNSYADANPNADGSMGRNYAKLVVDRVLTRHYQDYDRQVQFIYEAVSGYDNDGRFQVDGVKEDRLAVNDGRNIYMNVRGLKDRRLDLPSMIQLLLHEITHLDKETSLETRDAWGAKVTEWIRSKTQTVDINGGKVTAILLPTPKSPETIQTSNSGFANRTANQVFADFAKENYPIIFENPSGARTLNEFFDNIKTFDGKIGGDTYFSLNQEFTPWTKIRITQVKKSANGLLQIEYEQMPAGNYERNAYQQGVLVKSTGSLAGTIGPLYPATKYRTEIDMKSELVETQRAYSRALQEGDFEVNRVSDANGRRYVSLRAKLPLGIKSLSDAPSIHVIGKDTKNQKLLSFAVQKMRILTNDEVLLHMQVPTAGFEISQIILPRVDKEGFYSEVSIRPSLPISVEGASDFREAHLKVKSFDIPQKKLDSDKTIGTMRLKADKKIVGLTLDVEHTLFAQQVTYSMLSTPPQAKDLNFIGEGRKYFLDKNQLAISQTGEGTSVRFNFPETVMKQIQKGPEMTRRYSSFYTERWRPDVQTLSDNMQRLVKSVWIHFEDGSIEKVPDNFLVRTSIQSAESEKRMYEKAQARARAYLDSFDMGPAAPLCKQIFL